MEERSHYVNKLMPFFSQTFLFPNYLFVTSNDDDYHFSSLNPKTFTPGPWLMRFFRSGKNPHEPNPQHLNKKCMSEGIPFTYVVNIARYLGYFFKMSEMSESHTTEIHMSQGPGVLSLTLIVICASINHRIAFKLSS